MYIKIKNNQNFEFLAQTYREVVSKEETNKHIEFLQTFAGNYVFAHTHGNQATLVFSQQEGCLLAETLWSHIEAPENALYVQYITEHNKYVCIVNANGKMISDNLIPINFIHDEITNLVETHHLTTLIYPEDRMNKDILTALKGKLSGMTYRALTDNPIHELETQPQYVLIPVERALSRTAERRKELIQRVVHGAFVLVALYMTTTYIYQNVNDALEKQKQEQKRQSEQHTEIQIHDFHQQYTAVSNTYYSLRATPGWTVTSIKFPNAGEIIAQIKSTVGKNTFSISAYEWATTHKATFNATNNTLTMTLGNKMVGVTSKQRITQENLDALVRDLQESGFPIKISHSKSFSPKKQEFDMRVTFSSAHFVDFDVLYAKLNPYAAWISGGVFSFTENKLVGTILITIKGR